MQNYHCFSSPWMTDACFSLTVELLFRELIYPLFRRLTCLQQDANYPDLLILLNDLWIPPGDTSAHISTQ